MFPLFLPLILALPLLPSTLATTNVEVGVKPGNATADGTCGAKSAEGATCFDFTHGNCCSEYGWCGFSEAHCGSGCQHGFGDCFGEVASPSPYPTPSQLSSMYSMYSSYAKPTYYSKPTPSLVSSYQAAISSPEPGHYTPFSSRYTRSSRESTLSYSKPTAIHSSPSGYDDAPAPSSSTTPHYHPVSGYSKPVPSYSTPSSGYASASASTSAYASASGTGTGYTPPHPTVYATHTVTVTHGTVTETVYHGPSQGESGYSAGSSFTTKS